MYRCFDFEPNFINYGIFHLTGCCQKYGNNYSNHIVVECVTFIQIEVLLRFFQLSKGTHGGDLFSSLSFQIVQKLRRIDQTVVLQFLSKSKVIGKIFIEHSRKEFLPYYHKIYLSELSSLIPSLSPAGDEKSISITRISFREVSLQKWENTNQYLLYRP